MNKENEKKLFDRFSFFRPERGIQQSLMGFGFSCGDGWFELIWDLCIAIDKEIDKEKEKIPVEERAKRLLDQEEEYFFEVVQVKEKFAGLRFYSSGGNNKISELIDEAELKSEGICEGCGAPGKIRSSGWMRTLCDECEKERAKKRKNASNA